MTRRGNGLSAESYAPLADLAPPLADVMLDALREEGVAAYAVRLNSEEDGGVADEPDPGERPTDRLFVDADARNRAELVLLRRLPLEEPTGEGTDPVRGASPGEPATGALTARDTGPGTSGGDEDEIWQQIVAGYEADAETRTWPEREDLGSPGEAGEPRTPGARVIRPADPILSRPDVTGDLPDEPGEERPAGTRDEEEQHYVPPPPPPLPKTDTTGKLAWAALFGGPGYMLVASLLGWEVAGWAAFIAVGAFIAGFVTLVVRMGDRPPPDSGPDDGAVV
ncbi:MAG: hypothetical protein GEV11_18565 [Streptosporangiales bacterium]|nr:hypothetical protein [Streptosporangiales bacterium]